MGAALGTRGAGSVPEVQTGKQPSATMSAHHRVPLGAKGVGQPAVTLGYVAVQKGLGTRDISGNGDEQKSMTPVKKINNNKQVPCHQGQSPHEPGTAQRGCVGMVFPVPGHRGPIVCLVNRQGVGQGKGHGTAVCVRVSPAIPPSAGRVTPGTVPGTDVVRKMRILRYCSWGIFQPLQPFFLWSLPLPKPGTLMWRGQHGQQSWVQSCSSHRSSTVAICWQGPGCRGPTAHCHLGLL